MNLNVIILLAKDWQNFGCTWVLVSSISCRNSVEIGACFGERSLMMNWSTKATTRIIVNQNIGTCGEKWNVLIDYDSRRGLCPPEIQF